MPNKDKNIPKRRFKAFENADAWELRKLGEVATFAKGKGYSKQDLVADGSPIILYGRLYTKYETIISEIDTFISVNETRNAVLSEGGEVLVPASGESPADIARASVVTKKGIILGGDLNIIRLNSKISPIFLALTISNREPQKELSKRAQGKSVVHLHNSDLKEVEFVTPTLPEQSAIGTFFSTLDRHITLHQRKLDKLKSEKQAYLSEMFPAEGERVPKRRFSGFTDDWELRKLNNIADVRDGTHNSPRYIEFGYPLVTSKNIKNGQVNFEDIQYISSFDYEEINKRSKVNINDILMGMIGTVGNLALVREEPEFAIKNVALIKNIGVVNIEFLYHYLGSYVIERQLQNSLDGGTQKFISLNKIRHLDIAFPSLPEQKAIGTFFSTLDRQITLHQRKLEKLKNLKKALLNELFV
ncbi:TPA: restriction endonuclease subunit S [Streptococcus suis]|nr:restriction endonuclease subunit S [Streptococcus suis]